MSVTAGGNGKGIQFVAETLQHEREHINIYQQFNGLLDSDEDDLPDAVEAMYEGIRPDPDDPDTYDIDAAIPDGGYDTYGDSELRCRLREMKRRS